MLRKYAALRQTMLPEARPCEAAGPRPALERRPVKGHDSGEARELVSISAVLTAKVAVWGVHGPSAKPGAFAPAADRRG
jgi:hypothetical protein